MQNFNYYRNQKWVRLTVIGLLLLLVIILYFRNIDTSNLTSSEGIKQEFSENIKPDTWEKKLLLGVFSILGIAGGMEIANTDIDLSTFKKVIRDKQGNVLTEEDIKQGKVGKFTDEYNCEDFKTQAEAQIFYDKAGGVEGDTNRLDGNKDGVPCQSLPKS